MDGNEIIKNLRQIKELLDDDCPEMAKLRIGYLIDDIFMYKNNVISFIFAAQAEADYTLIS